MPQIGEYHAHVMNLLPCDLSVRMSNQNGSYNNHFDITAGLNSIIYDLKQGAYDIEVRADEKCPITGKTMTLPFVAKEKQVPIQNISYVHLKKSGKRIRIFFLIFF